MTDQEAFSLDNVTPEQAWQMHLRGNSVGSAQLSGKVLDQINTQNFTGKDKNVAHRHGEFARIAEQAGIAAFKQALFWRQARQSLIGAGQVVLDHYPAGTTDREALLRGEYWQLGSNEKESMPRIASYDMVALFKLMYQLIHEDGLDESPLLAMAVALEKVLRESAQEGEEERFDLIHVIKSGNYEDAKSAYQKFTEKYGLGSEWVGSNWESLNQIVTVSTLMFGLAFDQKDEEMKKSCIDNLKKVFHKNTDTAPFILSELVKNFSFTFKQNILGMKLKLWARAAKSDRDVMDIIDQLEDLNYVGLGKEQVVEI